MGGLPTSFSKTAWSRLAVSSANRCHRFSVEDIQRLTRTTFARDVEHHTSLASTNSHALRMTEVPDTRIPLLVLTDRQTAGRGRGVNAWWSAPGALTFSLVVSQPTHLHRTGWPGVALTTGMAVCEALHQLCPRLNPALKWPNDVYVSARKICGILVEVPPQPAQHIVIGVGVNVNNALDTAPRPIRESVTSLVDEAGYSFSLVDVLVAILQQLASHLDLLRCDPSRLERQWGTYCMLTGKTIEVTAGSRTTHGVCQGIDANGALIVETGTGVELCTSGTVMRWE